MNLRHFLTTPLFDEKVLLRNDTSWPKISVIIPSYNQGQFLERTILSVLNQNYPNLEFIIIDGGSNDNSVDIIKKYDKYLTYWVSEKDKGQSHAINKGLHICTGDYVAWQGSDDVYLPNAFKQFAKVVKRFPGYDVYYSNEFHIDKDDKIINKVYYVSPSWPFIKYYAKYRGMNYGNETAFFRRGIFREIGYLDESLHLTMDMEFFLRCILNNKKFFYVNSFWGASRHHELTKTARIDPHGLNVRKRERKYIAEKHKLYRGRFLPIISSMMAVWRAILLIKDTKWKGFLWHCKLRLWGIGYYGHSKEIS